MWTASNHKLNLLGLGVQNPHPWKISRSSDKAKRPEVGATVGPKTSSIVHIVFDLIYKAGLYKARFYSAWIWSNWICPELISVSWDIRSGHFNSSLWINSSELSCWWGWMERQMLSWSTCCSLGGWSDNSELYLRKLFRSIDPGHFYW